jgi:hypothetical protein
MQDCADRIKGRVQVTTDGHKAYLEAVEGAFGCDVDYAQLQKIYGAPTDADVERQNLTMRMRRFHRVALHFLYCNFARIHKTLRITPAMPAGLSDLVWSLEEIALLA